MPTTNYPGGVQSFGVVQLGSLGLGNVYHVIDTANSAVYADLLARIGTSQYLDGSSVLQTSIQTALDATMECRNDYVVCWPKNADIDITAALTMSKKAVHLICPSGMGYDVGANNSLRIEQTTDSLAVIAVSDAAVEIAGFYFKPDPTTAGSIITLAATSYATNIHHNYFTLKGSVTNGAGILGSGDGGAWGVIQRNKFECQVSSATYGQVISIAANATGAEVSHNFITIGNGSTATVGISNAAVLGNTNYNTFSECGGSGAASGGTITNCVAINASASAIGNIGSVDAGQMASGGTTSKSFAQNFPAWSTGTGADNGSVET